MENKYFKLDIDRTTGCIQSLLLSQDENQMNWCRTNLWGMPRLRVLPDENQKKIYLHPSLTECTKTENTCHCVYNADGIQINVDRFFTENGALCERYTIQNQRAADLFLEHADVGITLPFNDVYTSARDCLSHRCNTHLWCGGSCSYIQALKMGVSKHNLGLVLTHGSIESYSLLGTKTNHRGIFVWNLPHIELLPEESYVLQWQVFPFSSPKEDFIQKALASESFIEIESSKYTLFTDEEIRFTIRKISAAEIFLDGARIPYTLHKDGLHIQFAPVRTGKHRFQIFYGTRCTYAEFFVSPPLNTLIEARLNYIVKHQQYHRQGSPLDGAFLIYDTQAEYPVFNAEIRDHNACRERMGMALLLCRYLQTHKNAAWRAALDKFVLFVLREVFDADTGEVFNNIGKDRSLIRLYNAPWMATFFTEMYFLTKKVLYLHYVSKILAHYYSSGYKFYPNGLSMQRTYAAFKDARHPDADKVLEHFKAHAKQMMLYGTDYPPHEVNYEQTIVTSPATYLSELAAVTGEEIYKKEAFCHIQILRRFNGRQPSFHLNEIPIRYWDDFWFGKSRQFGDTFPHYWSCLSARAFAAFACCSGNTDFWNLADASLRGCLCLFREDGSAACAYVYPHRIDENSGAFYDAWANDQDFALYFYLDTLEKQEHITNETHCISADFAV